MGGGGACIWPSRFLTFLVHDDDPLDAPVRAYPSQGLLDLGRGRGRRSAGSGLYHIATAHCLRSWWGYAYSVAGLAVSATDDHPAAEIRIWTSYLVLLLQEANYELVLY